MTHSPLVLAGLLVLAIGAAGDITYHALDGGTPLFRTSQQAATHRELQAVFGPEGVRAHLVTLGGMVVTVGGLMQRGLSRSRT